MPEQLTSNQKLCCPECGLESVSGNKCSECTWVGCEFEDHYFRLEPGDRSVGLASYLECEDCGLMIDDDGRFDQDWDDNA